MIVEPQYECSFCHKVYVREEAYMKHVCKQMRRNAEIKTIYGTNAYSYYTKWMNLNKRTAPTIEIFTTSRYYTNFIKFAEYVDRVSIADVDSFIRLMVERDLSPTLWTHDQVYVLYIEHLDRQVGPIRQATNTIKTFFKIAEAAQCDVSDIFSHVTPAEVLQLIRQRRVSPWLLMFSGKFKQMVQNCTPDQRKMFEELIRPMFWQTRFNKHPDMVARMKTCIAELGL